VRVFLEVDYVNHTIQGLVLKRKNEGKKKQKMLVVRWQKKKKKNLA
jgi:hypothetical protein